MTATRDRVIWTYGGANEFVLVSTDEDSHCPSVLLGPPKVVWIGLGNCATVDVTRLLRIRRPEIIRLVDHPEAAFLALG